MVITTGESEPYSRLSNETSYLIVTLGAALYKPMKSWSLVAGIVGAADALTRGLAVDMAPIRVNSVCPGVVDTEVIHTTTHAIVIIAVLTSFGFLDI